MRKIEGFICIAAIEGREILFGKNMGKGQGSWQNFETNDLTPFADFSVAKIAKSELENRNRFEKISIAKIEMEVMETEDEINLLRRRKKGHWVVVRKISEWGETSLIGASVERSPSRYPVYGAWLTENGITPFSDFEAVEWTAGEEARQAQCAALIAAFKIKRL
jgi:hypothetical protein